MAIYMMREYTWTWETITNVKTDTAGNRQYYYGICFTPNTNCDLIAVRFLWDDFWTWWTLKISQWDYASSTTWQQLYTVSNSDIINNEYTLPNSYTLIANTKYCVTFKIDVLETFGLNNSMNYPISWDYLIFNYWTSSYQNKSIPQYNYIFSALKVI